MQRSTDLIALRNICALAIVSKVMAPSKKEQATDFYIDTMESVDPKDKANIITLMEKLRK